MMKQLSYHSKSGLFLMEMIFALLILSISSSICIQIFAAASLSREQAREYNHIREWNVTVGEFLEGSNGTAAEFLTFFPDGVLEDDTIRYYFNHDWKTADASARYCVELSFVPDTRKKQVTYSCYKEKELFYQQELSFPLFTYGKEDAAK